MSKKNRKKSKKGKNKQNEKATSPTSLDTEEGGMSFDSERNQDEENDRTTTNMPIIILEDSTLIAASESIIFSNDDTLDRRAEYKKVAPDARYSASLVLRERRRELEELKSKRLAQQKKKELSEGE